MEQGDVATGDGYFVHPGTLDEIAAAANRVADGVMRVGDDVAEVPTFEQYGEWLLGDASVDLVVPWADFLHAFAEELRALGRTIDKASKFYSGIEDEFGTRFRRILP